MNIEHKFEIILIVTIVIKALMQVLLLLHFLSPIQWQRRIESESRESKKSQARSRCNAFTVQIRARGIRTSTSQIPSSAALNIFPAAIAANIRNSAAPIQYISWRLAPNAAFGGFPAGNAAFGGANRPKRRRVNYLHNKSRFFAPWKERNESQVICI